VKNICIENLGIAAAREKVRQLISSGFEGEIKVILPKERYSPRELVFDRSDCPEACRVEYVFHPGSVADGGITLSRENWLKPSGAAAELFREEVRDKIYMADLSAFGFSKESWGEVQAVGAYHTAAKYPDTPKGLNPQVFCGDLRMSCARYPNEGYAKIEAVMDVGEVSEFPSQNYFSDWKDKVSPRGGCYIMDPAMAQRVSQWKSKKNAWLFGYLFHDWADSSTPVELNSVNRQIFPKFVSLYGCRSGAKYYFYNVPEELDAPGEWYLDRDEAKLFFCPGEGDEISFACGDEPILTCRDTQNLTFTGLTLQNTAGDGIFCRGKSMTFKNLKITKTSGTGAVCIGENISVENCEVSLCGKGGVYVTGGERETLFPGNNSVTGCYIHDFAQVQRTYCPGAGLYGVGNKCIGNEICRAPHMAVGYSGNCHLIEDNYIHNTVTDSSDAGAIYSGRDWTAHGTVIRNNLIRDIGSDEFKPAGIYWDDGLSGQTATGNVLINVGAQGFLVGGGRENTVRDNLLVNCGCPMLLDDRNRDGFVHGGWAKHCVITKEGFMWKSLENVPYTSGVWAERFPKLAALVTDFSRPDDADFAPNPSYSVFEDNIVIGGGESYIADSVYTYSTVGENPVYSSWEEAGGVVKRFEPVLEMQKKRG